MLLAEVSGSHSPSACSFIPPSVYVFTSCIPTTSKSGQSCSSELVSMIGSNSFRDQTNNQNHALKIPPIPHPYTLITAPILNGWVLPVILFIVNIVTLKYISKW